MGLLGSIIAKGVVTAARNSTIKAVGNATATVIEAKAKNQTEKEDVVVKNGTMFIKPTRSSEDYCDKNALDIAQELLGIGFESVTLKPVNKLGEWSKKRYGKINSISINGKNDFLGIKKVPASSYIVIEYLDFKMNVSQEVYTNLKRITPGVICSVSEIVAMSQQENITASDNFEKYCSYCGKAIPNEEAKFCSHCGKEIDKF